VVPFQVTDDERKSICDQLHESGTAMFKGHPVPFVIVDGNHGVWATELWAVQNRDYLYQFAFQYCNVIMNITPEQARKVFFPSLFVFVDRMAVVCVVRDTPECARQIVSSQYVVHGHGGRHSNCPKLRFHLHVARLQLTSTHT